MQKWKHNSCYLELFVKNLNQTIFIELSFNVETVLIWCSTMFDNCVAFCQSHAKVANVLSYTLLELK